MVPSPDPEFEEVGCDERGADGSATEACLGSVLAGGAGCRRVERGMKIDVRVEGCAPGAARILPAAGPGVCPASERLWLYPRRSSAPRTRHHHTEVGHGTSATEHHIRTQTSFKPSETHQK